MLVSDILDDAKRIFGQCANDELYRKMSDAIEMLQNKCVSWDASLGCMTLQTDDEQTIALPRDVETPLSINLDGFPTFPRSKWFEYHLNGPGAYTFINSYLHMWDDKGDFPTIRDMSSAQKLIANNVDTEDDNITLIVHGYDNDDRELTTNGERGMVMQMGVPSPKTVKKITDIVKPVTADGIDLREYTSNTLLGYYYADETNPRIRRIRVPANRTVTMMYRRRHRKVSSLNDIIPIDNRLAMLMACQATQYMFKQRIAEAEPFEQKAVQLLNEEQETRNAQDADGPQIRNFGLGTNESLWGRRRRGDCCRNIYGG